MAEEVKTVGVAGSLDAVKLLVAAGADVTINHNLFYHASNKDYRILVFDKNSNMKHSQEENFKTLEDGAKRFAELSGGILI